MLDMLITPLIIVVGSCFLQWMLSQQKSRWYGLILPALTFAYSLLIILCFTIIPPLGSYDFFELFVSILLTFMLYNLPTTILLAIYFSCRKKQSIQTQLDKLKAQD